MNCKQNPHENVQWLISITFAHLIVPLQITNYFEILYVYNLREKALIIINCGILSLTHSHHNCRQISILVWICHGGNLPLGHNDNHDDCVSLPHYSRCASELCNLLKTIWPSLNRCLKILKRGQLAPCNLRYNGNHWSRSEWTLVIGHNPKRGQTFTFQFADFV